MRKGNTRGSAEPDHWQRFDRLPTPFRDALKYANQNYKVGWVEDLIDVLGERAAFRETVQQLAALRRSDVRTHYGPTHPQVSA